MVDDHILRLDIPVHDANGMCVVQSLEYLVDVEFAIAWLDGVEDGLVVCLVDVFEDEAVDFALLDDVQ